MNEMQDLLQLRLDTPPVDRSVRISVFSYTSLKVKETRCFWLSVAFLCCVNMWSLHDLKQQFCFQELGGKFDYCKQKIKDAAVRM